MSFEHGAWVRRRVGSKLEAFVIGPGTRDTVGHAATLVARVSAERGVFECEWTTGLLELCPFPPTELEEARFVAHMLSR